MVHGLGEKGGGGNNLQVVRPMGLPAVHLYSGDWSAGTDSSKRDLAYLAYT